MPSKINFVLIANIFICYFFISCKDLKNEQKKDMLAFFSNLYPAYKMEYDSARNYFSLTLYNKENHKEESLFFDQQKKLSEYVFYNPVINEPRFLIFYEDDGKKIFSVEGKSLFLVGENFNRKKSIKDSFSVFVYLATPPYCNSKFAIHKVVAEKDSVIRMQDVIDDHLSVFIGESPKDISTSQYYISSIILDTLHKVVIKKDTVFFNLLPPS